MNQHGRARGISIASALVTALVGAAALALPGESLAAEPYGCACLHNNLASAVNYRFKWGKGEWKVVSLAPGKAEWMCWAYKDAPKSPELEFQLDVDMTSAKKFETFSIKRMQSKEQSCAAIPAGGHYHTGYVANSNKKKIQIFEGK